MTPNPYGVPLCLMAVTYLQAMEVDCWAALLKSPRAVLAGDHLQLPPTIVSKEAEARVSCPAWQHFPAGQYFENPMATIEFSSRRSQEI